MEPTPPAAAPTANIADTDLFFTAVEALYDYSSTARRKTGTDKADHRATQFRRRLTRLQSSTVHAQILLSADAWDTRILGFTGGTSVTLLLPGNPVSDVYAHVGNNVTATVPRLFHALTGVTAAAVAAASAAPGLIVPGYRPHDIARVYQPDRSDDIPSWPLLAGFTDASTTATAATRRIRQNHKHAELALVDLGVAAVIKDRIHARLDSPTWYHLPSTYFTNGWHAVLDGREMYALHVLAYLTNAYADPTATPADVALPAPIREGRAPFQQTVNGVWRDMTLRMDSERYKALPRLQAYGLVKQTRPAVVDRFDPSQRRSAQWAIQPNGLNGKAWKKVKEQLQHIVDTGESPGVTLRPSEKYQEALHDNGYGPGHDEEAV